MYEQEFPYCRPGEGLGLFELPQQKGSAYLVPSRTAWVSCYFRKGRKQFRTIQQYKVLVESRIPQEWESILILSPSFLLLNNQQECPQQFNANEVTIIHYESPRTILYSNAMYSDYHSTIDHKPLQELNSKTVQLRTSLS